MNENKILHVMILDKFLAPFIDFVDENFGRDNHHYVFITSEKYDYGLTPEHKVEFLHTDDDIFITLLKYMKMAKKIILHGLWRDKVDILLYFNQELLKKCYWVMWGGDFYFPETKSKIRHKIIRNMGHCIPVTPDDYVYLKSNYNTKAKYNKCINYIRSIKLESSEIKQKKLNTKKILIGNSATNTNRHLEIFNLLKNYKNLKIIVPLSYGDNNYAKNIIAKGKELFENFTPLIDFMEYDKYHTLLENIDIAIFNHNRQQGVGNILLILSMGKTLYLSKENNAYNMLKNMDISFFDIDILKEGLKEISIKDKKKNQKIILEKYNEKQAKEDWRKIFE